MALVGDTHYLVYNKTGLRPLVYINTKANQAIYVRHKNPEIAQFTRCMSRNSYRGMLWTKTLTNFDCVHKYMLFVEPSGRVNSQTL